MDTAERALLAETVNAALDGARDTDADAVLGDLGWIDMLDAETDDAIAIVFDALGRVHAASNALDDVVVHALGLTPRADLAVAMPPFGESAFTPDNGLATARVATAQQVVAIRGDDVYVVPIAAAMIQPIEGIDRNAGVHRVRVDTTGAAPVGHSGTVADTIARAQRAVAHETAGACRAMLGLAREHALERVQFGRPVARFQAVRHRLAEALVAVEALDAALLAAASERDLVTAQLAKIVAGRTARTVAAHCQQVLAGIGFTTDHPFHRYLKRTILLEGLFGSSEQLVVALGHDLLASRTVPTLIEL
jgi:hypothetical protein